MINESLTKYIEEEIVPLFFKNDQGHQIAHMEDVLRRSLIFANQCENIYLDMVYTIAMCHDVKHYENKDKHHILSAKFVRTNKFFKEYFDSEKLAVIC